jgi:hypothetical protein
MHKLRSSTMREMDKIKAQIGKKVTDIKFEWDDGIDDYSIESVTFEDGVKLELWGIGSCVGGCIEKWERKES